MAIDCPVLLLLGALAISCLAILASEATLVFIATICRTDFIFRIHEGAQLEYIVYAVVYRKSDMSSAHALDYAVLD